MLRFALGVALARNSCEVGEVYLALQFCTIAISVEGEYVWAQDEIKRFPLLPTVSCWLVELVKIGYLCLARPLVYLARLEKAIEFEASILVDGREAVENTR